MPRALINQSESGMFTHTKSLTPISSSAECGLFAQSAENTFTDTHRYASKTTIKISKHTHITMMYKQVGMKVHIEMYIKQQMNNNTVCVRVKSLL